VGKVWSLGLVEFHELEFVSTDEGSSLSMFELLQYVLVVMDELRDVLELLIRIRQAEVDLQTATN